MSDNKVKYNIEEIRKSIQSSRYKKDNLTECKSELSSKNFYKLMKQRGLDDNDIYSLKTSIDQNSKMQVRHANKGENYIITHGEQNASGIFISEHSLGKTPKERIDKGSLPCSNSAKYETKITLDKPQNLVYGKIAPQPKFQKIDHNQLECNGGEEQIITDGGYKSSAIRNNDTKYPITLNTTKFYISNDFINSLKSNISTVNNSISNEYSKNIKNSQ